MIFTSGIFLFKKYTTELLLVHPTNAPKDMWSIPKGECNFDFERQMYIELFEETNIIISEIYKQEVSYVGNYLYTNGKKCLVAFHLKIPSFETKNYELKCTSMIQNPEPFLSPMPEVDRIEWMGISTAFKLIHDTQKRALIDIMDGKI